MVEDNFNSEKESKNESELYALIHTILNAYEKFQEGSINNIFFQKTVKNTINDLMKFNFYLDEKKIDLSLLLKKMNLTGKYYEVIRIINSISSIDLSNTALGEDQPEQPLISKEINPAILELPRITLEITSSFITLMDALKLKGLKDSELITNLFKQLIKNIKKFPGIDDLLEKTKEIYKRSLADSIDIERVDNLSEIVVDEIYQIFKQFQYKLDIKQHGKQ
ncbi:MAG: hypothetical protein ACW99L_15005 [Promethearchaeota archaeon]|jgi:hypothetical protein